MQERECSERAFPFLLKCIKQSRTFFHVLRLHVCHFVRFIYNICIGKEFEYNTVKSQKLPNKDNKTTVSIGIIHIKQKGDTI